MAASEPLKEILTITYAGTCQRHGDFVGTRTSFGSRTWESGCPQCGKEAEEARDAKDRAKDVIISGGENISSIEVEDVLYRHPAVLAAAVVAKPAAAAGGINPEEVLVSVGGQESTMQYIIPTVRTAARALGFGGVATYATLQGRQAGRKLPASGLEFIVSVPKNAQAAGYLTLANFAVRNNGTREVQMGGGL